MKTQTRLLREILVWVFILSACVPATALIETRTPEPTATLEPSPTPRPEKNVALRKPVRVSAYWIADPPERAVDGILNNWWGAGGTIPQWIEVDLEGIYSISKIRLTNQGPTGMASYRVIGRGPDNKNRLLHVFHGNKFENQKLEFSPESAWEDICTIRIEINEGSGWVGLREVQVFSRDEPKPLPISVKPATPPYLAQVDPDALEPIAADNAVLMKELVMLGRGHINDLSWSPDGMVLAAASPLGVWLYDPAALNSAPRLLEGHTRDVLSVVFNQSGTNILSASQDGTVKRWEVATGALKQTISLWNDFSYEATEQNRNVEVWSMAFNPNGTLLAAGSLDGRLSLWDLSTGKTRTVLKGHTSPITHLTFSPDGKLLASAGSNGDVFIWDVKAGSQQANLSGDGQVQDLVFSPDSKTLAYGGVPMPVHLWNTVAGDERAELSEHSGVLSLAYSPDGNILATGDMTGMLKLWDDESASSKVLREHADWVTEMAYSPDGKTLATYAWDGTLRLWEIATGIPVAGVSAHTSPVTSIAFSPDGKVLASGGEDNMVRLWDIKTNHLLAILWRHTAGVTGVAFGPDGKLLASSSFDRTVRLWDTATGNQIAILEGHESYVRCVAVSPDGKTIASGSTDRTVRLWDTKTGKERFVLTGHEGEVESVAFSPDGLWLVSASADKSLRVWEVATGKEADVLHGHLSPALGVAFNPNGTGLASVGQDFYMRLWKWDVSSSPASGRQVGSPRGHSGSVLSVAFSPGGDIVADASMSTWSYYVAPGEIHLYSSDSGYPYVMLRGPTKRVTSIAFSPDGKLLASGSADGSVRLWGVIGNGLQAGQIGHATGSEPTSTQPKLDVESTPTPTPAPNLPKDGNLALNQNTSTSNSESGRPSKFAVDGNTSTDWGSGNFPPQWIEIDLGAPATLKEMRLLVTQYPDGNTIHRILVGSKGGEFLEIHRFEQVTRSGQWLDFKLEQPLDSIQIVRVETLEGPSWVGWVEIEVIGER